MTHNSAALRNWFLHGKQSCNPLLDIESRILCTIFRRVLTFSHKVALDESNYEAEHKVMLQHALDD